MRFAILGPVEVRRDGVSLQLGGPKQRALLAFLLLHANEAVSRDRLVEALWGERPPAKVDQSLDSYVSRLRRVLGSDRLRRQAPGYLLSAEPAEVDLDRFESLLSQGRDELATGHALAAAEALSEALALWRGPALADILYEPFASHEAARLEERRHLALEAQIEAELVLGRGAELVPRLERIVAENPLRERPLAQLMLALYRAGRQSEALAVARQARQRLADELGLEPAPEVRALERRILQHDPALTAATPPPAGRIRRRRSLAVTLAAALAAVGMSLLAITRGDSVAPPHAGSGPALVAIDAGSGGPAAPVALTSAPGAMAIGAGSIWVAQPSEESVARVAPGSGAVVDRIRIDGEPGSIAAGAGAIWVASTVGGAIRRIDPATGAPTQTIELGVNAPAIAFGSGRLWVADATDHALIEIDAATGSVRRTLTLDVAPSAVAVGSGAIWVAGYNDGSLTQIDAKSAETVATIRVGQGPAAVVAGGGAVWVANDLDSTVSKIDPRSGAVVATIPVGSGPGAIALGADGVWVANTHSGTVSRLDPNRNAVVETIPVGGRPAALAANAGRIFVGVAAGLAGHRGGTLRLITTTLLEPADPAAPSQVGLAYSRLLYDGLVTFEVAAGPRGLRLVPDLALAIPAPSDGGMTYRFRLRPGIRYSNGRPLRARDFRRAVERLFRVRSQGAPFYDGLFGAAACRRKPRSCDLSRGMRTDDSTRAVVFHLRRPDPDFLYKLTAWGFSAPVPAGTPDRISGSAAVPGTGPYRLARRSARELRLSRNPFFREWSHAAQPQGNPNDIIWRFAGSFQEELHEVEQGRADWIFGLLAPAQLRRLELLAPGQLRIKPSFLIEFFPLNTHRPPFDDVRVRQALNYAIDRRAIARMYGGAAVAIPHCQPLTPVLPGFRRYCPYTARPGRSGGWSAPDIGRARALVAASGTRGQRIDVWGTTDGFVPRDVPRHVAALLRSLGYRVTLHLVPHTSITPAMRRRFQISVDGDWLPHYPRPSAYLPQFFGCRGGTSNGYVCNPRLDRRMEQANALELTDARKAAELWSRIDHEITDQAYWVTTVNGHEPEFVSKRLRNYQYSPVGDFIADQVWLR